MKIRETNEGVRIFFRAPIEALLSITVRAGPSQHVWDLLHSSFKPIEQPVLSIDPRTGETVEGIVLDVHKITRSPISPFTPDGEDIPDENYGGNILIGQVPAGYRQEFPDPETPPMFRSGRTYFISVWSTERMEQAQFTKK